MHFQAFWQTFVSSEVFAWESDGNVINTVDLCFVERNLSAKCEITSITSKCSKKHMHILLNFKRRSDAIECCTY